MPMSRIVSWTAGMVVAGTLFAGAPPPPALGGPPQDGGIEGAVVVEGLMWAVETNGENVSWNDAAQYCRDLRLGGRSDWRLPTIEELQTLWDATAGAGGDPPLRLETCCLWSSTALEDDGGRRALDASEYAWGFYFPGPDRYYSARNFTDGQALCARRP